MAVHADASPAEGVPSNFLTGLQSGVHSSSKEIVDSDLDNPSRGNEVFDRYLRVEGVRIGNQGEVKGKWPRINPCQDIRTAGAGDKEFPIR